MKRALVFVAALSTAYAAYRWQADDAPARARADDDQILLDRLWVDHLPRSDRDTFHVFAALTEQPVGIFQATSQWQGAYEIFRYEAHGDELRMFFPQTGEAEKVRATARRCDEGGMDFCLELSGSKRGAKRYYSLEGWEIGSLDQLHARTAGLRAPR
jgi:hypothetical protein